MSDELIDTNILAYAFINGKADPRSDRAKEIILELARNKKGCVAVQNLVEFCSVCLTKAVPKLNPDEIIPLVREIQCRFPVLVPSHSTIPSALEAVKQYQLSYWDALIWAVAKENGVIEILTEDMQDGQNIDGVRIRNPFK